MAKWAEHVQPHGAIEEIGAGLWQVTGALNEIRCLVIWSYGEYRSKD